MSPVFHLTAETRHGEVRRFRFEYLVDDAGNVSLGRVEGDVEVRVEGGA